MLTRNDMAFLFSLAAILAYAIKGGTETWHVLLALGLMLISYFLAPKNK